MAQSSDFPLRKPPGFHWDFFLLGVTTLIAGLLGVPAPNGLIPQAPIHTMSLLVMGRPQKETDDEESATPQPTLETVSQSREADGHPLQKYEPLAASASIEIPMSVVEQRLSNFAQGGLCLVLLTGPFLHVLGLIPRGVLAGLL